MVGLDDYIFDISVTANRAGLPVASWASPARWPPCWASPCTMPATDYKAVCETTDDRLPITVKAEAPELCPRYIGTLCPQHHPRALSALDEAPAGPVRPAQHLSNVVDITNYVMLEIGQPMHAFDMDTLESCQITSSAAPRMVRKITTLGREELQADRQ